jgi:tetratricopeptide (TPR) repeat protein
LIDILNYYLTTAYRTFLSLINSVDWESIFNLINRIDVLTGIFGLLFILIFYQSLKYFRTPVVESDTENNPRRLAKAAKEWSGRGEHLVAAGLYVKAGKLQEAGESYEKANAPLKAGDIFLRLNDFVRAAKNFEKAKQYEKAAGLYIKTNMLKNAAESYEHLGNLKAAAELYEKSGDFEKAGELYQRVGLFKKSAEMFRNAGNWEKACIIMETMVNNAFAQGTDAPENNAFLRSIIKDSIECFRKVGKNDRAAEILERSGLFKEAALLFSESKNYKKAADLFSKTGEFLDSAQCYEKAGLFQDANRMRAKYHESRGEVLESAKIYETMGDLNAAAMIYEKTGNVQKAAELFFKAGQFLKAGEYYEKAQNILLAAEAYEKAGELKRAGDLYHKCGNRQKEIELLERSQQYLKLAMRYREQGLNEQVISTLQKIPQSSPDYIEAVKLLAETFKEKGELTLAISKYREALSGKKVTENNIDSFYELASLYEKTNEISEAIRIYEDILKVQYHYRDVVQRVHSLKEKEQVDGVRPPEKMEQLYAETKYTVKEKMPSKKKYEILEELGRGAMGIVYKARDTILQRVVALKVMPKVNIDNKEISEKFLLEARTAAKLNHPNIVTVYDAGDEEGDLFIAMEYIEGLNIKQLLLQKKPMPVQGVLFISAQICKGLGYAHENKVIHRDIKPTNIMWTPKKLVKILDFGLAKVIQEMASTVTIVGGTPHYMSPEQTLGEMVDYRTDIYSLGVTMFEMATGKLPFSKGDIGYHHIHTPPPNPKEFNKNIPDELAGIIMKCMAKKPADRYQSAFEIFDELKKLKV